MSQPCVFCSPRIEPWVLWEGTHYRIAADAFPRMPGHVLLISRQHVVHHADAPPAWQPEFEHARDVMREFLLSVHGAASFWENGHAGKEVPHAHLHGFPLQLPMAPDWAADGKVRPVADWDAVREHRDRAGDYTLIIPDSVSSWYLSLDKPFMLNALRRIVTRYTGETLDPSTGGLRRGGVREVEQTRRLWAAALPKRGET